MPHENEHVELLRGMLQRVGRHSENPEALYELLAPDAVLDASGLNLPDSGVYVGHQGFRDFWRRWLGPWEAWEWAPEEFIGAGDKVVVAIRQRARGRGSGVQVEEQHAQVWTFQNSKIIRQDLYPDMEQALRAAGIAKRPPD